MERAVIILRGRVQKAGYRDYIDETAFHIGLKGLVRNLSDGAVEVVCEGSKAGIEDFINKIQIKQYPINVEGVEVKYSKATGEYKDFEVVRDEDLNRAVYERMDTAARYMREMNKDLGEKITSGNRMLGEKMDSGNRMLGEKIDNLSVQIGEGNRVLGEKMDNVGSKLESFHQDTAGRFDVLDVKYGRIAENMEKAIQAINRTCDNTEMLLEKSERDRKDFQDSMKGLTNSILKLAEKR